MTQPGVARRATYGGQSSEQRSAERRERLVTSAVRLFAARTYDEVTVADICTLAKVSKRYFYDYFTDREDLMLSVHQELNDWLLTGIAAAAPEHPDSPESLIRPMMTELVHLLLQHPDRARVIYISAPRMERRRRGILQMEAELFGRLFRPVIPPPQDQRRYTRTLLGLIAGVTEVVIEWVSTDMLDPPAPLADHLTAFAVALLSPSI